MNYPIILKSKTTELVVLFYKHERGIAIHKGNHAVGHHSIRWNMDQFDPTPIDKFEIDLTPKYEYPILMVNKFGSIVAFTDYQNGYLIWQFKTSTHQRYDINDFKPLKQST